MGHISGEKSSLLKWALWKSDKSAVAQLQRFPVIRESIHNIHSYHRLPDHRCWFKGLLSDYALAIYFIEIVTFAISADDYGNNCYNDDGNNDNDNDDGYDDDDNDAAAHD